MSPFPRPDYIWFETSWKYKVTGLRSATADVSIIGHLSCQSVLEQKTRTLPVCLIQALWSKISAKVVKCYWLDSSCSLLLSSQPVCFFYPPIVKVGRKHWADVSAGFLTGFRFYLRVWIFFCWKNSQEADRTLTRLACSGGATNHPIESWKGQPMFSPQKKTTKQNKNGQTREKTPNALSHVVSKTKW